MPSAEVDALFRYAIFGDLNQQGTLENKGDCESHQNGRGGTFYIVKDEGLYNGLTRLLKGGTVDEALGY
jgi:hypothetical protein